MRWILVQGSICRNLVANSDGGSAQVAWSFVLQKGFQDSCQNTNSRVIIPRVPIGGYVYWTNYYFTIKLSALMLRRFISPARVASGRGRDVCWPGSVMTYPSASVTATTSSSLSRLASIRMPPPCLSAAKPGTEVQRSRPARGHSWGTASRPQHASTFWPRALRAVHLMHEHVCFVRWRTPPVNLCASVCLWAISGVGLVSLEVESNMKHFTWQQIQLFILVLSYPNFILFSHISKLIVSWNWESGHGETPAATSIKPFPTKIALGKSANCFSVIGWLPSFWVMLQYPGVRFLVIVRAVVCLQPWCTLGTHCITMTAVAWMNMTQGCQATDPADELSTIFLRFLMELVTVWVVRWSSVYLSFCRSFFYMYIINIVFFSLCVCVFSSPCERERTKMSSYIISFTIFSVEELHCCSRIYDVAFLRDGDTVSSLLLTLWLMTCLSSVSWEREDWSKRKLKL